MARHFDLAVIGSGPAGQKGAINAAKMGKKVAIIDRKIMLGGVSTHTGTIPSKMRRPSLRAHKVAPTASSPWPPTTPALSRPPSHFMP